MEVLKKITAPIILLVALLGYMWWKDYRKPAWRAASAKSPAGSTAPRPISNADQPQIEGRWMVDEIARDIAEIVLYATDSKADPAVALKLSVSPTTNPGSHELNVSSPRGDVSHSLTLKHHVWSPDDYQAWAAALLKAWQPKVTAPDKVPDGGALTRNLTDLTTANLIREERRLSALLNKAPLSAELHEQAALVVGTFTLREAAGNNFTDVRTGLCRVAAHLALAQALRPETGVCGELAEVVQLTLATLQTEALERIAKLPVGLEPWVTALKMRNTGDWRLCEEPAKATVLEQIAWARAVAQSVDATPLQVFIEKYSPPDLPDWSRAIFGRGFSVEHGHFFATNCVAKEMADITTAWRSWSGKEMQEGSLVQLLNDPARRTVVKSSAGTELAVLGWGQIAAQHQRHLCNALYFTIYFLRDRWGVPDQAAVVENHVHTHMSGLRLYPFIVRCLMCSDAGDAVPDPIFIKAMRDAAELCRTQPQIVSTANWALLTEGCGRTMPVLAPPPGAWFQPSLPHGTAFDFEHRINDLHLPHGSSDLMEKSLALAPYDFDVIQTVATHTASHLPADERDRQAFKNISAFHLRAMRQIAKNSKYDPKAYTAVLRQACALDPNLYLDLGEHLVECRLLEEAAAAYQAAYERAPDRVHFSNECDWVVNYYFDTGRKEDALKIAQEAAQVYSFRGLQTAGRLMERMEQWDAAARHYAAIAERYGSSGPLMQFLMRHKDSNPKVAGVLEQITKSQFPNGMKQVSLADFKEAPSSGCQITSESQMVLQSGLKGGDIIVALDDIQIESFPQYDMIRALSPSTAPLILIVWNGTKYRQIIAPIPDRRFGCDMQTYEK